MKISEKTCFQYMEQQQSTLRKVDEFAEAINAKIDIPQMPESAELMLFKGLIFIILAILLSFNTPLYRILNIWAT